MIFTSDLLLQSIKTRAMIPSSQNTFQDSDLINLANEEMETFIVGTLMRVQEEYLVTCDSIALVSGQTRYRIPSRALGQKVRDVYIDNGTNKIFLPRILPEDIPEFSNNNFSYPYGFYVQNNYLVLVNSPNASTGNLVVSYFLRPGTIVTSAFYSTVTAIDNVGKVLTMTSLPAAFVVGALIDVTTAKSGSENIIRDVPILAVDTVNFKVTVGVSLANVNIGDFVTIAQQSAVPQCPEEMHPLLAQRVVCRVLEALNDQAGLQASSAKLKDMEINILALIANRIVGKPKKVRNTNGFLRFTRAYFR